MQPLSRLKRRLYLSGFILLFFVLFPFVIFYATGYRFVTGLGFVQMGGIFVSVPYSNARIVLDDKEVGMSTFLNRGFYLADLIPGIYTLRALHEGSLPWTRILVVEPELVTDARALLAPEKLVLTRLRDTSVATSSERALSHAQYVQYTGAFKLPAATTSASSLAGEIVVVEKGDVFVRWALPDAPPPSYFCGRPSSCTDEIAIERGELISTSAVFFGSGIVYRTKEGNISFAEADVRPTPVAMPVYAASGADFRIIEGHLIIKSGQALYEVENL